MHEATLPGGDEMSNEMNAPTLINMMPSPPDGIDARIDAYRAGKGLGRDFYLDPAIYERDLARVFRRHWHCIGHMSIIPNAYDFEVFSMAGEEVILTRDGDGAIHAMLNVCRHKGAAVCTADRGNARSFVCPYHAWTYGIDGALKAARVMPRDFDRAAHGLRKLHVQVAEGLIFVTFADAPLDFAAAATMISQTCGVYGWADAKVVHRVRYPMAANWKLAVENYVECYHCGPAHPEYSQTHVLEQPPQEIDALNDAMAARTRALGLTIAEGSPWESSASGREAIRSYRYALKEGVQSASVDGGPVAPLMGQFPDYDGGITSLQFGGTSFMAAYPDHGVIYRFIPTGVESSEMEISWLVAGDAVAGRDYDLDRLTWLWRVTSDEDKAIIEATARGVRSHYFQPGPIAPMEAQTQRLITWYLGELSRP
jgi:phenylpropionate dioxygenase-like ring-hydroxylating dioxygenase large terminal subunit